MSKKSKNLKNMADLLRRGATLTERACPACSAPLFKLKSGDLWCAQCEKRVIVVKEGAPPTEAASPIVLSTLEATILTKIQEMERRISGETDIEQLQKLNSVLSTLLENLQKIRKMEKT